MLLSGYMCGRIKACSAHNADLKRQSAVGHAQVRCLVDVPGEKLPSQVSGALSEYLSSHVANEVRQSLQICSLDRITSAHFTLQNA